MATQRWSILKLTLLFVMSLSLVGVAQAGPVYHGILPDQTFLRTDAVDVTTGPVFIYLSAYGVMPGTAIYLQTLGDICMTNGGDCTEFDAPLTVAFTTDNTLGGRDLLNRLTAVGPPAGVTSPVTLNTWFDNLTTDIAQDFEVAVGVPLYLVVPEGGNYLAVGVADSYYRDNSDPDGNLGIVFDQVQAIPEPGTLILLASGLGMVLLGFRRKRSS